MTIQSNRENLTIFLVIAGLFLLGLLFWKVIG